MQTIHINLVSDQLLPNLIPTFADEQCCGVVLVLGDETQQERAKMLSQLYMGRGLPIVWRSEGSSSHRLLQLQKQANSLIEWLDSHHADKKWMLNATCGTKPMALAFANAFNRFNTTRPETAKDSIPRALILYTDSQNKEFPLLNEGVDYALPWRSVMSLDEMLAANGFEMTSCIDATNDHAIQARAELTRYLGKQFQGACQKMLGGLQGMAVAASQDFPSHQHQTMPSVPYGPYAELYQHLVEAKLLAWDGQSAQIQFLTEEACRYLAGCWLEELAYLTALPFNFEQVAMGVEGRWRGETPEPGHKPGKNNEFDLLICHNNQLLTVECKAKQWSSPQKGESTNQDVVLKLESLSRKLGGIYGERLLISARPLPEEMKRRAQDNRIRLCEHADGKTIHTALQTFFNKIT